MNFEQIISEEIKKAVKSGEKIRLETLRSIKAAIIEFNKSGAGRELAEEDSIKILNTAAKKRRDAIQMFEKGGRDDLVEKEKEELKVIREFLPEQLSSDDIEKIIKSKIDELGATDMKDFGKVMGAVMKELKGKADGSVVQGIVKKCLGAE